MAAFVSADVLINEYLPDTLANGEWVELFNNGSTTINLNGWNLTDNNNINFSLDTSILANDYVLVPSNFADLISAYPNINSTGKVIGAEGFLVSPGANSIFLYNSSGVLVDNMSHPSNLGINVTFGRYPNGKVEVTPLSTISPLAENDNQTPSLNSWIVPVNNSNVSSIVNITVNITDDTTPINFSLVDFNGTNNTMSRDGDIFYFVWNTSLNSDGVYNISVYFNDSYGLANNFSASNSSILFNITVDNTRPTVVFILPQNNANLSGSLENITINGIDATTGVKNVTVQNGTGGNNISMFLARGSINNGNWTTAIDTTEYLDGQINFTIDVTDFNNNSNNSEFVTVTIDNTKPTVSFVNPAGNANVSGSVNITVTLADTTLGVKNATVQNGTNGNNISMTLIEGTVSEGNWSLTINSLEHSDGLTNFTINANDFVGNNNESEFVTLTIDNTQPTVSFVVPQNASSVTGTINLTMTATDANTGVETVAIQNNTGGNYVSTTFLEGSITAGNWTLQLDTTNLNDGDNIFTVNTTDFAGVSNNLLFLNLSVDNSGPSVTFNSPVSNANLSGTQSVNVTVTDAVTQVDNVSITLVNGSGIVFNFTIEQSGNNYNDSLSTASFSDGSYNISVFANDTVGKTTYSNQTITIDNTAPTVRIVSPTNNSFVNNGLQYVIFNVTDPVSGVREDSINSSTFKYTFSGFTFSASSISFTAIDNGLLANGTIDLESNPDVTVNVTLSAQDSAGNSILGIFSTYSIDLGAPKVANLSVNDSDTKVRSLTPLNISVNVTNGVASISTVNVSNSSVVSMSQLALGDLWAVTSNASELGCTADGNCTVTVKAFDAAGNLNNSETLVLLIDNLKPNVSNINVNDADLKVRSSDSLIINATVNDTNFDTGSTVTAANSSSVNLSLQSTANETTKWSVTTNASALGCSDNDGACTIRFTATDIVGNANSSETLTLTVDDITPNVSISINSSSSLNNITVLNVSVTAADTNTVSNVSINGTSLSNLGNNVWTTTNITYELCPGVLDSTCTLTVSAFDEVGNLNNSETLTLTISSFSPSITGIPDITFNEDSHNATVNLSQFITDQDTSINDITVGALGNSSVKIVIDQTTKMLNVSAATDFNGQENVVFTATDGTNTASSNSVTLTVSAVNDAPTAPNLTSPTNNSNVSKTFATLDWSNSTDVESNTITYFVFFGNESSPAFNTSTTDSNATVINLTKGKTYFWKVIAGDSNLNSSNSSLFQFVAAANTAPVLSSSVPNVTWLEDIANSSINLSSHFSDGEGDTLTYNSTTVNNVSVSINQATGIVTLTPGTNFNGTRLINFTASDGTNSTKSNEVTLTVTNVNDAPVLNSIGSLTTPVNKLFFFDANATDSDTGDTLTFSSNSTLFTVDSSQGNFSIIPTGSQVGSQTVNITVSDAAGLADSEVLSFTITDVINSTEFTSPVLSLNETERQSVTNVTVNQSVSGGIDFGSSTLNFSGVENLEDAFNISNGLISVDSDTYPGLNKSASIVLKGLSFTKVPIINVSTGFNNKAGSGVCPSTICTNITYDATNKILRFDVAHFTTFFTSTNTTNGAPQITSSAVTSASTGSEYRYDVDATDPDSDTLTYSLTTSPSGMSISSSSGLITYTPGSLGNFSVVVQVSDNSLTDTQSYNLTVGEGAMLRITDLDIEVGGKKAKNVNNNTKIKKEAEPGDKVEFDIEISSFFTKAQDLEVEDIEVEVTIQDIDDGDDLEEDAKEFDLDPTKDDNVKIDFEVPLDVDEDTYDVLIDVEGDDQNGTTHRIRWKLELEVEKEKHEIRILRASATPSEVVCQRTISINTEIINTGSEDEDEVTLEVSSVALGINFVEDDIELDEGTDDNRFTKLFNAAIDNDVVPGVYPVTINSYYDGKLSETETVDLNVKLCELAKEIKEPVKEKKPQVVEVITPTPTVQEQPEQPIEISFVETDIYTTLLAIMIVLFIGTAIFVVGAAFIVMGKK